MCRRRLLRAFARGGTLELLSRMRLPEVTNLCVIDPPFVGELRGAMGLINLGIRGVVAERLILRHTQR